MSKQRINLCPLAAMDLTLAGETSSRKYKNNILELTISKAAVVDISPRSGFQARRHRASRVVNFIRHTGADKEVSLYYPAGGHEDVPQRSTYEPGGRKHAIAIALSEHIARNCVNCPLEETCSDIGTLLAATQNPDQIL